MDVAPLRSASLGGPRPAGLPEVARQIEAACREHGFFYVTGHGVAPDLLARLTEACAAFFALPQAAKMEIAMARGGPAWRGYFPVGAELTSGRPDLKEGLYFGAELGDDDPRVRAGLPLHGRNLFPRQVPELRSAVLRLHRRADRSGPGGAARRGAEPGPGRGLLRRRVHGQPDRPVPGVPVPGAAARRGAAGARGSTPTTAC